MARRLAREEGLFTGISSGCNVAAALKVASALASGFVTTLLCDNGLRYLSTELVASTVPQDRVGHASPERTHDLPAEMVAALTRARQGWTIIH
jgi:hypothetical protein